jgi:hypothetical protein
LLEYPFVAIYLLPTLGTFRKLAPIKTQVAGGCQEKFQGDAPREEAAARRESSWQRGSVGSFTACFLFFPNHKTGRVANFKSLTSVTIEKQRFPLQITHGAGKKRQLKP